ncbi:MAG: transcription-repair coupling factor [Bdellovibrionales bacterium]|nr:transcription-repair coupling factor [Bdellovibrionales bacterium]
MSFLLSYDNALAHKIKTLTSEKLLVTAADPLMTSAFILATSLASNNGRPRLVITKDAASAERFRSLYLEFVQLRSGPTSTAKDRARHVHMLPAHDISPYSGLYSNRQLALARLGWLYHACFPTPEDIFIAPLKALAQKSLPQDIFVDHIHQFAKQQDLPTELPTFLNQLGYSATPLVEDAGTYTIRGGIVDIYSPAEPAPLRIELFGDQIESLRYFDPTTQRSLGEAQNISIVPAHEVLFDDEAILRACQNLDRRREGEADITALQSQIRNQIAFDGLEFLLPYFYPKLSQPLDYFSTAPICWWPEGVESESVFSADVSLLQEEYGNHKTHLPEPFELYQNLQELTHQIGKGRVEVESLEIIDSSSPDIFSVSSRILMPLKATTFSERTAALIKKSKEWRGLRQRVLIYGATETQYQRLQPAFLLEGLKLRFIDDATVPFIDEQENDKSIVHFIRGHIDSSITYASENLVIIGLEHYLKKAEKKTTQIESELSKAQALSFSELRDGDPVVHTQHGVAIYMGLKVMNLTGVDAEFLELKFKDNDKLFLPIYRLNQVHKYTGAGAHVMLDKLGGKGWEKAKAKVQTRLREIATELVALYARRQMVQRPAYNVNAPEVQNFEDAFPYEGTPDQLRAINDIKKDLSRTKPMDRLVCGDVGFGKTEVAMRAAFMATTQGKQVAVLAPTTILTFQHYESFKKRFKDWPIKIAVLNRFVSTKEANTTLAELREGKVDILIGTHRLFSQDVVFKDLGLLILDEEQKFGVKHKEKVRILKNQVDTLAMSATPIPRTLNMSLLGIRDLSLINTPPNDRLPTRTFVSKFDAAVIKKAVMAEVKRGGQVFFLHNRVQSIYNLAGELRELLPGVRIGVGHGQMDEHELEKTIVSFFHKEIDMLVCTTIIESGMDIPNANTMFIDQAHALGLSQLYQLRGRVGRSKQRAFCYLLIPRSGGIEDIAKERLRILQQNTALGSGIQIAQYDLELRGAGSLLGEEQSGAVDAIGYEMYMALLEQAVHEARGEKIDPSVEPEINLKIKALIPHAYMPDIRLRLSYYKALSGIKAISELDGIEEELRDQFGQPPEEVYNLLGLMTIRHACKELGIRDVSSGASAISLAFTESTPLPANKVVELSLMPNKKYALTPDNRLKIRMNEISWQNIYEELNYLRKLAPFPQ